MRDRRYRGLRPAVRVALGLAGLVCLGTVLLMLPVSARQAPLSVNQAFFTAVSALATTGLSLISPGAELSTFGQLVLLALMQIGGLGFIVGSVIVFRLLGRRVTLSERLNLRNSLGLVSTTSVVELTGRVVLGVLGLEALGALGLWLCWRDEFGAGPALYYAVWHAVSAFTNSSFDLLSGAPEAPAGFPSDAGTLLVISSMVVFGNLGLPVISDLFVRLRRGSSHRLSLHSRVTLGCSSMLLLLGTVALFIGFSEPGALFSDLSTGRRLLLSYFHAATARTSGFVLAPLEQMSPANVLCLCVLMFIGGSPASMAGGITTSTFAVLMLATASSIRGREEISLGGRTIPQETVAKAVAVLVASLIFVLLVAWLLMVTQSAPLDEAIFESVSAFSTCGFTLGLTARLNEFGQVLLAFAMFAGRLGVLTLVVALTQEPSPSPLRYPEERILIG